MMTIVGRERRTALGRGYTMINEAIDSKEDPNNIRQAFIDAVSSRTNTIEQLKSLFLYPIPDEIGPVQFSIRRDQSGMNRLSPKYYLTLVETNSQVLSASKSQSLTLNMHIKVDSPFMSFISNESEASIARLRGNNSSKFFYIYDFGVNPKDVKPG